MTPLRELSEKDKWDLLGRAAIALVGIVLIAALAAFALYKGHDGVMLSAVVGVIGSIILTFLGLKVKDLMGTMRGK